MKSKSTRPISPKPRSNGAVSQPQGDLIPRPSKAAQTLAPVRNAYREFVGSSLWQPYLDLIQSMPHWSDDIERDFGLDIYDRMDNDPVVSAALDTLVFSILEHGCSIAPAMDAKLVSSEEELRDAETAAEVARFVEAATANMEIPLGDVLQSMLRDALKYGWKLAEITLKNALYEGEPCYFARCLDPKPREVYRLVVDRQNHLIAVLAIIPGVGLALPEGIVPQPQTWPNTVTPEKFVCLTMPGKDRNPMGRSRLRCVYMAWWLKTQCWVPLLQWIAQLAGSFIWGEVPDNATPPEDNEMTIEDAYAKSLSQLKSGATIAVRTGGSVHVERPEGDGDQFWHSIDGFDRQILTGLLTQAKSHKEAEKDSKANVSAGSDLTDTVVDRFRSVLCGAIERSFFNLLVKLQFGDETAARFTPRLNLNGVPQADWAKDLTAAASAGFTLEDSPMNKAEVAERLELTPDLDAYAEAKDRKAAATEQPGSTKGNPRAQDGTKEQQKHALLLYRYSLMRALRVRARMKR